MAVEITEGLEGLMTEEQWLSTCWRNTWKKEKKNIWIKLIFPCLLAMLLAGAFTWIVWVLLNSYNVKDAQKLKWASLPATIAIIVWNAVKSGMSLVTPVSSELMNYIKFPDHKENLGYQDKVISDIKFLKREIGRKPYPLFSATIFMWQLFTARWIQSLLDPGSAIPRAVRPSDDNDDFRIILFVDDLDRCEESVILQVLSAINLVLAECKIDVILGMDKDMIERAILKRHGDDSATASKHLADMYLQKIVQLPLDLPDPSQEHSKRFLEEQLNIFHQRNEKEDLESETNSEADYNALFSTFDWEFAKQSSHVGVTITKIDGQKNSVLEAKSEETRPSYERQIEAPAEDAATGVAADKTSAISAEAAENCTIRVIEDKKTETGPSDETSESQFTTKIPSETKEYLTPKIPSETKDYLTQMAILMFTKYSEGEEEALFYFQKHATGARKLPREWKRFLHYHRVVRNMFLLNNEAKNVDGWQVQLMSWIFICWEWQENMNVVVQNWDKFGTLEPESSGRGPSLQVIVEHCIQNYESWTAEKSDEDIKGKSVSDNIEDPESSNRERVRVKEDNAGKINISEIRNRAIQQKSYEFVKEENNSLRGELVDMVKKEIKESELLKEIKELKEQVSSLMKQQASKREETLEEKRMKQKNWKKMKSALDKYDVSMEAIKIFERFRFYCTPGYLSWPLPKQENAVS